MGYSLMNLLFYGLYEAACVYKIQLQSSVAENFRVRKLGFRRSNFVGGSNAHHQRGSPVLPNRRWEG
jgi:hypothetical protein